MDVPVTPEDGHIGLGVDPGDPSEDGEEGGRLYAADGVIAVAVDERLLALALLPPRLSGEVGPVPVLTLEPLCPACRASPELVGGRVGRKPRGEVAML